MSSASSEHSLASSGTDNTLSSAPVAKPPPARKPPHPLLAEPIALFFIVFIRCLNATSVVTFFQPDEFFQSLEPAWRIAFGEGSGAWITWEWRHQLRSSIHPYLFAGVYYLSDLILNAFPATPELRARVLIITPKLTQGVFAGLGDYFTWKLASRIYGTGSPESYGALALTTFSPWQYFCAGRTFSNCLETTLTVIALYFWPWHWTSSGDSHNGRYSDRRESSPENDLFRLRVCLLLAAVACVLRPTNLMVWVCLFSYVLVVNRPWTWRTTSNVFIPLVREAILCGSAVVGTSLFADRAFFGSWTLPPVKFLYFNLAQSLAVFYGKNDWHYYLTQGYPLLLTTYVPFALIGLYQSLFQRPPGSATRQLAFVCVYMPAILSLISHKEVRFIYPLLPSLHVLAAPSFVRFFRPALTSVSTTGTPRMLTLIFLFFVNFCIGIYVSHWHAGAPTDVFRYLRHEHNLLSTRTTSANVIPPDNASPQGITVGFLMPCHSTPWRSHLVYPTIHAWALTCEPPINFNATEKAAYVDEADQFYDNPSAFLRDHMVGGTFGIPSKPSYQTTTTTNTQPNHNSQYPDQHNWPDYLVFFSQLEPLLSSELRGSAYGECYRRWNTAWHDDWRRKGDMIVWCLDEDRQNEWRQHQKQKQWKPILGFTDGAMDRKREKHFEHIIDRVRKEAVTNAENLKQGVESGGIGGVWDRVSSLLTKIWGYLEPTQLSSSSPDVQKVKLRMEPSKSWFAGLPYMRRRGPVVEVKKQPWWQDWTRSVTERWHRFVGAGAGEL